MKSTGTQRIYQRIYKSDRFIPDRAAMDMDYCHYMVTETGCLPEFPDPLYTRNTQSFAVFQELLATNLLHETTSRPSPMLAIRTQPQVDNGRGSGNILPCSGSPVPPLRSAMNRSFRRNQAIPSSAALVIDAPALYDDYYSNLMAWGANGVLAIALRQFVYLYCTTTGKIQCIRACFTRENYVTSVAWVGRLSQLAVGTLYAELQLWDVTTCTKLRSFGGHVARVSCLSWSDTNCLASGSRDTTILLNDVRAYRHIVAELAHHSEEVCGLAWSSNGRTLASGSNDNGLCLWDSAMVRHRAAPPRHANRDHRGAVRALAWCPWESNLLASGGGAQDGTIKLWETSTGQLKRSVPTGSQVCALGWSSATHKLVSTHGHFSQANQISLWDYPDMTRARDLIGHDERVLHLAISPNGARIATAADETVSFWDLLPPSRQLGNLDRLHAVIR